MYAVDGVLILLMLVFAISGYRQGFVTGVLSFGGFFVGAVVGLQVGPLLAGQFSDGAVRVVVSLVAIFALAVLGQTLAGLAGTRLRRSIAHPPLRRVDDAGGAVVSLLAVLLVAWLVAIPLKSTSVTWLNREVRGSAVLAGIDGLMPRQAQALSAALRTTLDTNAFPEVFSGLTPTNAGDVAAPDPALAKSALVLNARRSVLKVRAYAPGCARRIDGSSFVYAPERVLTNAHVVAGARDVQVETEDGPLDGTVVLFEPERDIAVIHVPGLRAPRLPFADAVRPGASAIVLGYPLGGPYNAQAARIGELAVRPGMDIYETREDVKREIYTMRSLVRSGNSGGPLMTPEGRVLGVVFAAARDDRNVGYALSAREVAGSAQQAEDQTREVDTGDCAA
ncbi:MarP family serine protease [Actinoplanes sp. NPDC051633]|uniref:MarP family serine protease n=1 Tax=Actinoplanes sp. NPDC051633 TaxID=3155670 RepID=UPI0034184106